jgi:hypothetical protein
VPLDGLQKKKIVVKHNSVFPNNKNYFTPEDQYVPCKKIARRQTEHKNTS